MPHRSAPAGEGEEEEGHEALEALPEAEGEVELTVQVREGAKGARGGHTWPSWLKGMSRSMSMSSSRWLTTKS